MCRVLAFDLYRAGTGSVPRGFELRELAVGGALRAAGHLPARGELQVGFGGLEGCFVVVAPLVEVEPILRTCLSKYSRVRDVCFNLRSLES